MTRRSILAGALTVFALTMAGCEPSGAEGSAVDVAMKDWDLTVSPGTVPAGKITFSASNEGPSTHEFEIFAGAEDIDLASLPIEGSVANTEGLTLVDEVEDVVSGTTAELTVDLEAGTYAVVCNLPDHYAEGMYATLVVE